jgi:hypothetical protein
MLSLLSGSARLCDGLTRREALRVGGLSALGLSLPHLLAARAADRRPPRARSCILLWMTGGPPQHETWDPKPDAPAEIRGPFGTIPTAVPGVRVGELMPRTARRLDRLCVVRAMVTNNPGHAGSSYELLTGAEHPGGKGNESIVASRSDFPTIGAIVKRCRSPVAGVPTSVVYPQAIFNVPFYPGQDAGLLGSEWDPWRLTCDPAAPNFSLPDLALQADVSPRRLGERRDLLDRFSREFDRLADGPAARQYGERAGEALGLLASSKARAAFDLHREPATLRDRYGRTPFGQGCLLARRLVEAGVALVQLNWHREPNDEQPMWDAHHMLVTNLKNKLMPPMDQGYTALLDDLDQRGLLSETLVVWVGEMGRTPKLESIPKYPEPGRNHWGGVFSLALAGAGVRGGLVHGASDRIGGYPKDNPIGPSDLTATIYSALGVAPETEIRDRLGRPLAVSRGRVLHELY